MTAEVQLVLAAGRTTGVREDLAELRARDIRDTNGLDFCCWSQEGMNILDETRNKDAVGLTNAQRVASLLAGIIRACNHACVRKRDQLSLVIKSWTT